MTNVIIKIAKAHEILRRISTAGTPSITAKTKYPTPRVKQIRFGIVKVNKSIDAAKAIRVGKKAKAERWRKPKAIFFQSDCWKAGPRPAVLL
jgi:hypothetical protein